MRWLGLGAAAVAAVTIGVAAAAGAFGGGSQGGLGGEAPPPPGAPELASIRQLVLQAAARMGDEAPTDGVLVPTTRRLAELVDVDTAEPDTPVYFALVHGEFTDYGARLPKGAKPPTGTILTLTIDPGTNQSLDTGLVGAMPHGPTTQPVGSSLDKPPCPTPRGGWLLTSRTPIQERTIEHYSHFAHHHDLVSIAFYDQGSVLTVASSNPARTRAVLGPYWRLQLCVVKARYTRATLVGVGKRLERLMTSRRSAELGWITGAGGTGPLNDNAQPTTSVEVLLETPQLRALLQRLPRGLVVVEAALRPVGRAG